MPSVLRVGPYRFFFFMSDRPEPPHIHVRRDEKNAKYWLEPVELAKRAGFRTAELNKIERIIREHQQQLLEAWHETFGE